jgi:hypothetical protein
MRAYRRLMAADKRQSLVTTAIARAPRSFWRSGARLQTPVRPPCGACLYKIHISAIMVMKHAEDGHRYDAAHVLDGAMDRSVFVERPMRPQLVVVGGIPRQNPAQVSFAQDNHMVDARPSSQTRAARKPTFSTTSNASTMPNAGTRGSIPEPYGGREGSRLLRPRTMSGRNGDSCCDSCGFPTIPARDSN